MVSVIPDLSLLRFPASGNEESFDSYHEMRLWHDNGPGQKCRYINILQEGLRTLKVAA